LLSYNSFCLTAIVEDEKMLYSAEDRIASHILNHYNINPGKLALDYTNYFTYIDSNNKRSTLTKRGHNKQKRNDLRQFSLGLVTTREFAIPLCSYVYEGNITDVTAFPRYLDLFRKRIANYTDATDITLIYDNGSVSKKNLAGLKNKSPEFHYICAFSINSCKELLDISVNDYTIVNIYDDKNVLCYRTTRNIWGDKKECVLIFSEDLYTGQYNGLLNSIKKKQQQLQKLKEQLRNPNSRISKKGSDIDARVRKIIKGDFGEKIFNIQKNGVRVIKDIDVFVSLDIAEELCHKHYGKRLIITDQFSWTTKEILEAYWDQSKIENIFRDSKNRHHFSIQPQFHWTDSKVTKRETSP
jgi:transposase